MNLYVPCRRKQQNWFLCEDHYHCDICEKACDDEIHGEIPASKALCAPCCIKVIKNEVAEKYRTGELR
jgi:hypothetical protein